jgi:DNA-binding transcriptional regulator YiaG
MDGLGAMLDFAVNSCGEDTHLFCSRFLSSGIAKQMERGNPRYLCGMSGIEIALAVAAHTGSPLNMTDARIDMGSPEYWTGWTLAYLQWYLCMDFKSLHAAGVSVGSLSDRYGTLHEADLSKSVAFARKQIEAYRRTYNPLKVIRKSAGLSQQELADQSGITLRSIRAYEQFKLQLSNAESATLVSLSRTLGCTPSDLITQ